MLTQVLPSSLTPADAHCLVGGRSGGTRGWKALAFEALGALLAQPHPSPSSRSAEVALSCSQHHGQNSCCFLWGPAVAVHPQGSLESHAGLVHPTPLRVGDFLL